MSKYREFYISKAEFEMLLEQENLYEGFVVGVGYAYSSSKAIYEREGMLYDRPTGSQFSVNMPHIIRSQILDDSAEAIQLSLKHQIKGEVYGVEVVRGDTLGGIANELGVTVDQLVEWNAIHNPNLIHEGELLFYDGDIAKAQKNALSAVSSVNNIVVSSASAWVSGSRATFALTNSKGWAPKAYASGWRGNQYVKPVRLARIGRVAGVGGFVFGGVIDGLGVLNYYNHPHNKAKYSVSPFKASLNLGMSGLTFFPPTTVIGVVYFVGDAFGWENIINAHVQIAREQREAAGDNYEKWWYPKILPK